MSQWKMIPSLKTNIFAFCWLMIGIISAYDVFWVVQNQECLIYCEQNPFGLWILQASDGNVSYFVAIKMICTILVLGVLSYIWHYFPRFAMKIIVPIFFFQVILFVYLVGYDSQRGLVNFQEWIIFPTTSIF